MYRKNEKEPNNQRQQRNKHRHTKDETMKSFCLPSLSPTTQNVTLFISCCFLLLTRADAFANFLLSIPTSRGVSSRSRHVTDASRRRLREAPARRLAAEQQQQRWHDNDAVAPSDFIATCVPGLSKLLAQELESLGCAGVETTGEAAVRFRADGATALRCLVWARVPHKVMEFLGQSSPTLRTRQDLHRYVYDEIPVQNLLGNGRGGLLSLSVSTILNAPRQIPADINHSHYTALTVKNALCDAVRDLRSDRPNVDLDDPDVPLVAVLRGTPTGAQLSLYRQLHSHGSLHKRGYRPSAIHKAALKESLAAGLLYQAGWHDTCRRAQRNNQAPPLLLDPMAGSGTLVIEGILMAADLAPHLIRIKTSVGSETAAVHQVPPILRWKDYADLRQDVWPQLLREATDRAKTGLQWLQSSDTPRVYVNDMHTGALSLLDESLHMVGLKGGVVEINAGDCADWKPSIDDSGKDTWTVVCNPPWGVRLEDNVEESWQALSKFLKQTCPTGRTTAYLLSGNAKATKLLGLRRSQSMPVKVGTQDLRWLQYEFHAPEFYKDRESVFDDDSDEDLISTTRNSRRSMERPADVATIHSNSRSRSNISSENEWSSRNTGGGHQKGGYADGTRGRTATDNKKKQPKAPRVGESKVNEWMID